MGKSDPIVLEWYRREISIPQGSDILILGQRGHNAFTASLNSHAEFRDVTLGNWEINSGLDVIKKYDAVICTRCAYFSSNPSEFVRQCMSALKPSGGLFVDWGLGDHWRFDKFRVGWNFEGGKEYAVYANEAQYLRSAAWRPDLEADPAVLDFKKNIRQFGYDDDLSSVLAQEVDVVYQIPQDAKVTCLSLWPSSPQLYVLVEMRNEG